MARVLGAGGPELLSDPEQARRRRERTQRKETWRSGLPDRFGLFTIQPGTGRSNLFFIR